MDMKDNHSVMRTSETIDPSSPRWLSLLLEWLSLYYIIGGSTSLVTFMVVIIVGMVVLTLHYRWQHLLGKVESRKWLSQTLMKNQCCKWLSFSIKIFNLFSTRLRSVLPVYNGQQYNIGPYT